ncbi:MAG: phosphodiester glycosidase family protein, partial [Dokdonella sp.]
VASQSGPMLLIDGSINPKFDIDSDSRKWRSGVCAPRPDRVEFVVSTVPVSFHEFARVFRDQLGCRDALYLDGTLSRIWTAEDGYSGAPAFLVKPYVGIFAVFDEQTSPDR